MGGDVDRKLRAIFAAHNARVEKREREAEEAKKRQFEKVSRMHEHLSKVIVPALRRIADSIQMTGQKVTVVETGPIGSPEISTAQVKLTIIPRGHDTADPNELPRIVFQSGREGISATGYSYFPGRGGHVGAGHVYQPAELTMQAVESLVLELVEETFGD